MYHLEIVNEYMKVLKAKGSSLPIKISIKTSKLDNLKFNSNNRSLEICKRKIWEKINTLIDDLNDLNEEEIEDMKKTI